MNVTAITNWDELAALRREWEALASAGPDAGPFLSWPWAHAWLSNHPDAAPCLLAFRESAGELRALLPLVNRAGRLSFIAADRSPYLGFLARTEDRKASARAFARWLCAPDQSGGWRRVVLSSLPLEQLQPLERALQEAGVACRAYPDRANYVLPLPDSAAAFHAQLPKSFRKRLDYYLRRLQRERPLEHRILRPREQPQALEEFMRLHLARSGDRDRRSRFADAEFADFVRQAFIAMNGSASVGLLQCEGRAVAALAGIAWGDTFYFWNGGFDPDFAHYNVGDIIQRLTIETAITAGMRRFDFLWGAESYKLRWGAERRATFRLDIERSRLRLVARAARCAAARAVSRLRARRPTTSSTQGDA